MLISVGEAGTTQQQPGQESMGMLQCCRIVVCYVDQNRPVCWSTAVEEKLTAGSPLFGTFPSDRIPRATKDGKVHFF